MLRSLLIASTLLFSAGQGLSIAAPFTQETAVSRDLVQRGRKLLDAEQPAKALELFEQADGEAGGVLETRMWVLRAWMDQGRVNDALNEIDRLRDKGAKGPALDYLYGMGSFRRALRNQAGGMNKAIGFAFGDAVQFLTKAIDGDAATFYDAWVPLTQASWATSEFERGRDVGSQAVTHRAQDPEAHFWYGRNLFALFQQASANDPDSPATKELIAAAAKAFDRAAELTPIDNKNAPKLHRIHLQRGYVALWRKRPQDSHVPFAEAIGWEPSSVDYSALLGSLKDEQGQPAPFVDVLSKGHKLFVERWGTETPSDATLLWWLGFGQLSVTQYAAAEASYVSAVSKWPAYSDSWWYAGRARYFQENYEGAVEAWGEMFKVNPESLVNLIGSDLESNTAILEYAKAKANEAVQGGNTPLIVPIAGVAEAVLSADPSKAKHWNDVGLFSRDAGVYVSRLPGDDSSDRAMRYWERSWETYQKAIELDPSEPAYLNDGAVVLHYNLQRDLDKAAKMYEQAIALAQKQIESGDFNEADLAFKRIALRDATNNLAALRGNGE